MAHLTRFVVLALMATSSTGSAIVIRDDVADAQYRVPASEFPALVDLPDEGHGVLIAPQWVITAAHVVSRLQTKTVFLNGASRNVERVVTHPGYAEWPQELFNQASATGDATMLLAQVLTSDDIALLKLTQRVTDVTPAAVYKATDEFGQIVKIVGKGATGTGVSGQDPTSHHRTELRRAFNRISSAHERWFCYVFDQPPSALPLEGMPGTGDSGGPALIQVKSEWLVAGLTSFTVVDGHFATFRTGLYGRISCNVRLSHYGEWIARVTADGAR